MQSERLNHELTELLARNRAVTELLRLVPQLRLPDWYLGAGCIAQTVWNHFHGYAPDFGVKDYDLVYYDATDLSWQAENERIQQAAQLFDGLNLPVEVRNQARVHLWYEQHFGYPIEPYRSAEHAISSWPTTATAVGVRRENMPQTICAPYGLDDLFALTVRPVKVQVTREIYLQKARRWAQLWPKLNVLPWD